MRKIAILSLLILFGLSTAAFAQSANVTVEPTPHYDVVRFNGAISRLSVFDLINTVENIEPEYVYMTSPGGDARESMVLGAYFQDRDVKVVTDRLCLSGCALAAMGAESLRINGAFGMHTFSSATGLPNRVTLEQYTAHTTVITLELVEYWHKMGYSKTLLETLFTRTDMDTYAVISTEENLQAFKTDDFFQEVYRPMTYYRLLEQSEILNNVYRSTDRRNH